MKNGERAWRNHEKWAKLPPDLPAPIRAAHVAWCPKENYGWAREIPGDEFEERALIAAICVGGESEFRGLLASFFERFWRGESGGDFFEMADHCVFLDWKNWPDSELVLVLFRWAFRFALEIQQTSDDVSEIYESVKQLESDRIRYLEIWVTFPEALFDFADYFLEKYESASSIEQEFLRSERVLNTLEERYLLETDENRAAIFLAYVQTIRAISQN